MSAGLSPAPRSSTLLPDREGDYLRCEGCGSLLRFLLQARDGGDLCKRCLDGRAEKA